MKKSFPISSLEVVVALLLGFSTASGRDTIRQGDLLRDGDTLVSANEIFVLGFFSRGSSSKRYLGMWYRFDSTTVVWVANREKPQNDSSGSLIIDDRGNLVLTGSPNVTVGLSRKNMSAKVVAQLQDSGNFVVREESSPSTEEFLWQSFDYPADTLLPGMKLGWDYRNHRERCLQSWNRENNPSKGPYTYRLDPRGMGQPMLYSEKTVIYRSGPWNGLRFSGNQRMKTYPYYSFAVRTNQDEMYFQYNVSQESTIARLVVDSSGFMKRFQWFISTSKEWDELWSSSDACDKYGWCGPNGLCQGQDSQPCNCLEGFHPRNPGNWKSQSWSEGCVRTTSLRCGYRDGFLKKSGVKLPDTVNSTVNMNMTLHKCEEFCRMNCSCVAYAPANISEGERGCVIWAGDLIDMKAFSDGGQDLYVRLEKSDLARFLPNPSKKGIIAIVVTTLALALASSLLVFSGYSIWRRNRMFRNAIEEGSTLRTISISLDGEDNDLPRYNFDSIASATNNFAQCNKIGSGGFGEVYKGILQDEQVVAVKRLSTQSGDGIAEFTTEVRLIAKLQHRNLVRLLGFCVQGGERLLIYEYMPNRSLDVFIFGEKLKRLTLDWAKRSKIILGIARGLLYLHQDSRLRVIHRDLKAANILLDEAMNPKISDFGTARVFDWEQIEHNTVKIVGTMYVSLPQYSLRREISKKCSLWLSSLLDIWYSGYMSPEYLVTGNFSEKSDVFSFGVLVLEILSGRRNRMVSRNCFRMELLANAWRLWEGNQSNKLLDSSLGHPTELSDVLRLIQISLLCVQESPDDRPTMLQVVFWLSNKNSSLPRPLNPGFFHPSSLAAASQWFAMWSSSISLNMLTETDLEGR